MFMLNADMIRINEHLTRLYLAIIRLWTFYTPDILITAIFARRGN